MGDRKREVVMTLLWRSPGGIEAHPRPVATGVRGSLDFLCPACSAVVLANMVPEQVAPGSKAFCPGCGSALEAPDCEEGEEGLEGDEGGDEAEETDGEPGDRSP
jgi:hypothetical protein